MRFDLPLLKAEFSRAGMIWPEQEPRVVDAHVVYQEKERRDLTAAVKYYCGDEHSEAHSALADARATRRVLEAQIRRYPDLPNSVEGLDSFCKEARPNKFADSGYWFLIVNVRGSTRLTGCGRSRCQRQRAMVFYGTYAESMMRDGHTSRFSSGANSWFRQLSPSSRL